MMSITDLETTVFLVYSPKPGVPQAVEGAKPKDEGNT